MTEERLDEIRLRSKVNYSPYSSVTPCDFSNAVSDVRELLEALREAQADFEDMKHVAFGNQKYVDAEQRGYQLGIEAAIGVIEITNLGMRQWQSPRIIEDIRKLLPVAATTPPPAEDADPHRAQRLRFIEGCKEIGKVLKGTPMDETPAEEGEV